MNFDSIVDDINRNMGKVRENGLVLSDEQVEILKRYEFDYRKYSNLSSLIYDIEYYLNECSDAEDLEWLSSSLSEINYYNNTNK